MATKNKQEKQTLENILRLETIKNRVSGTDLKNLELVLDDLRKNAGSTVSKTNAAEILKVSRQTIDRWVNEGMMPVKRRANGRQGIPREAFERLAREVNEAKTMGQTRSFLASALRQVADDIAPERKTSKKATAKKATAKKATAKKATPKKATAKKATAKKATAKKATAKK